MKTVDKTKRPGCQEKKDILSLPDQKTFRQDIVERIKATLKQAGLHKNSAAKALFNMGMVDLEESGWVKSLSDGRGLDIYRWIVLMNFFASQGLEVIDLNQYIDHFKDKKDNTTRDLQIELAHTVMKNKALEAKLQEVRKLSFNCLPRPGDVEKRKICPQVRALLDLPHVEIKSIS